jgi:hypothetical protein
MVPLQAETLRKFTLVFTCLMVAGLASPRCNAADAGTAAQQTPPANVGQTPRPAARPPATRMISGTSGSAVASEGTRSAAPEATVSPSGATRYMEKSTRRMPLTFTPSAGHASNPTQFQAIGKSFALSLEKHGVTFETFVRDGGNPAEPVSTPGHAIAKTGLPDLPGESGVRWQEKDVQLDFLGASEASNIEGLDATGAKFNYFLGNDPSQWRRNVPAYSRVRYSNVYPGVDMIFYGRKDGGLEYDLVVAAGADPQQIRFRVAGDQKPVLDASGNLQLDGKDGKISLDRPMLYQDIDRGKRAIAGAFVQVAENEFAFKVSGYDRTRPLIIDPTINLVYSTYMGGRHPDDAYDLVLDASGNSYLVGATASVDFPITSNAYQPVRSNFGTETYDAVVMKFDSSGLLLYATYLGGTNNDYGQTLAIDSAGDAYFGGSTISTDFPTTANAYSTTAGAGFFAEIGPDGSTLLYSSYYPAALEGITFNANGNLVLLGTSGPGLATTSGSYKPTLASGNAAFVTYLNLAKTGSAQLVAATYYGTDSPMANSNEVGNSLIGYAFDSKGNIWFGGQAYTPNLPTTSNAYQASLPSMTASCQGDGVALNGAAYIAELSADLSTLDYATYFSGKTTGTTIDDCSEFVSHLTFDPAGNLYAAGGTASATFPVTSGVFQGTNPSGGGSNGFVTWVAKFAANTPAPTWSSYFGGNAGDTFFSGPGHGIVADAAQYLWISGQTAGGTNFPISNPAYQSTFGGGTEDGFVSQINPGGTQVLYSTYIGGSGYDGVNAMALDASNNIYLAGSTLSTNFPVTPNALQSVYANGCQSGCDGDDMFFAILGGGTIGTLGPIVGGNTGDTTITVNGAGFASGATCDLVQGGTTITALQATVNATGTSITCAFALTGVATGSYNVVVGNPGGTTFTDKNAFTVESGGQPDLSVTLLGRPEIRTGAPSTFYINVTNSGSEDAYFVPLWITFPIDITTFTVNGYAPGESGYVPFADATTNYANLILNQIQPGQTISVPLQITSPTDATGIPISATLQPPWFSTFAEIAAAGAATALPPSCEASATNSYSVNCLGAYLIATTAGQFLFTPPSGVSTTPSGVTTPPIASLQFPRQFSEGVPCASPSPPPPPPASWKAGYKAGYNDAKNHTSTKNPYGWFTSDNDQWQYGYSMGYQNGANNTGSPPSDGVVSQPETSFGKALGSPVPLADSSASACPVPPQNIVPPAGSKPISGGSYDPNYKSGPSGDNSAKAYVRGTAALSYSVGFENEATATLPAAAVVVTDQLNPAKVDLTTLSLGTITFGTNIISLPSGTNNYATTYTPSGVTTYVVRIQGSLNTTTGLLKWTFQTIDPTTGLPPTDPTVGFLPPDVDGVEGQGSVQFSVMPMSGQTSGTQITNTASVVFDANAPIATPAWLNTLDVTAPVSMVSALPATEASTGGTATFTVSWSGTDADSGINSFTIYVSDNGGAFTPWETATTDTSDSYTGTAGHTYGFYSIATDNAGNVEAAKTTAEATTEVTAPVAVTLSATSEDFGGQNVTTTSAAKMVTLTNSGTQTLTISSIAASGDFAETNTCGASVSAGGNCMIAVTFTPTATGARTGSVTITDNAPDSPESVSLTGMGQDFTFAVATGDSSSATVTAGSPANYTLSVAGEGGLSGNLSFTCTGAPSESTCTVTPNPAPVGNSSSNVAVAVTTTAPAASAPRSRPVSPMPPLSPGMRGILMLALLLTAITWAFMRRRIAGAGRWRATMLPLGAALLLFLALAACGGGGGSVGGGPTKNPGTPSGTYMLTVTATAGSGSSALNHTVMLTIIVQ